MNICAIAFSLEWFTTIPGMLITGGVILLLIAFIMLIVGSSKGKKKNKGGAAQSVADTNAAVPSAEASGVVASEAVMPSMPTVEDQAVTSNNSVDSVATSEPMGPITESVAPTTVVPEVATVQTPAVEAPTVEPVVNPIPTVDIPPIVPATPVESPIPTVEPVVPTETIEPVVAEPVLETPDALNLEKTSVNIYGGASVVPNVPVQEEARPIYGGANPLDATQNLPKMDVHHEPYSGGQDVVNPIPTVDVVPAPQEAPVVEAPVQEPVQPPVVEAIPVVEPTAPVATPEVVNQPVEVVAPAEIPVIEPAQQPGVVQIPDVEQL